MAGPDPYAAFDFVVAIDGVDVAGFSEVSGLEFEIDVVEYRDGNDAAQRVRKIPGLRRYGNIVLKRGITGHNAFWDWILQALDGPVAKHDGEIMLLSEQREPVVRWHFTDGWPCKYLGPDLNAAASEIAIESVEICHEGLRFID